MTHNSLVYSENKDIDKLKAWIYPMFFSTKGGLSRIQIIKLLFDHPKKIQTLANETKTSYYFVRYHIKTLTKNGFLVKKKNNYCISPKFQENYHVLDEFLVKKLTTGGND